MTKLLLSECFCGFFSAVSIDICFLHCLCLKNFSCSWLNVYLEIKVFSVPGMEYMQANAQANSSGQQQGGEQPPECKQQWSQSFVCAFSPRWGLWGVKNSLQSASTIEAIAFHTLFVQDLRPQLSIHRGDHGITWRMYGRRLFTGRVHFKLSKLSLWQVRGKFQIAKRKL